MLERITQLFEKAISGGGKSVLGIDIGTSSVKVVQLRKEKGAAVLETYGELSLGPYADLEIGRATTLSADKLSEALTDVMTEANVTTRNCGVSIPFSSSLITLIELPKVDNRKLQSMIPIEARKYIPVPITEVQLDWFVIPEGEAKFFSDTRAGSQEDAEETSDEGKVMVLLVAIHNDVLRKYNTVIANASLQPSFYEIEIFSTIRATISRGIAPVVILDIGAATTKLYVVEYGVVRTSHVINKGAQDITMALANSTNMSVTKAEELKRQLGLVGGDDTEDGQGVAHAGTLTMEYIFSEAQRAVLNYQRSHNTNVTQVILTGGGATMKGVLRFAREQFEVDVRLGEPFSKVNAPAFLHEVLKEAGPEFAVAVGLALRKLQDE